MCYDIYRGVIWFGKLGCYGGGEGGGLFGDGGGGWNGGCVGFYIVGGKSGGYIVLVLDGG